MPKGIISSFEQFKKTYGKTFSFDSDKERVEALKRYLAKGGFVRVLPSTNGSWPILLYPDKIKIKNHLSEVKKFKEIFEKKKGDWVRKRFQASTYFLFNDLKKFKEKLYWQHTLKLLSNKEYRKDAKKVSLPTKLVADKKWKPMIKMFVLDEDYRKQLVETLENSIVYAKDKKLAKYASALQEFRKEVSSKKINSIDSKLKEIEEDIKMLNVLQKWFEKR